MAEVAGVELAEFVDALRDQIRIAQAGARIRRCRSRWDRSCWSSR